MKTLIMCATPYHLINAINIVMMEQADADLVIYNHFKNAKELVENVKNTHIFSEVMLFDDNNYDFKHKIKRGLRAFIPEKSIKKIATKETYNRIIFFALDFINIAYIIHEYECRKIDCEYAYGDDGIGTYADATIYEPSQKVSKILAINGNLKWLSKIKDLYLTTPSLLENSKFMLHEIIFKPQSIKYIKELWPINKKEFDCNYIYLQEPISDSEIIDKEVMNILSRRVGKENFKIKLHPREYNWNLGTDNLIKGQVPFERIMAEFAERKFTLISICSTAAITSVLLFKSNVRIIFLYNLSAYMKSTNFTIGRLCEDIERNYDINISTPRTFEELDRVLGEYDEQCFFRKN